MMKMIIDTHMHLGFSTGPYNYPFSVKALLELMDELEIGYSISAHGQTLGANEYELGEREVDEAFALSGGRIRAYHLFDPRVAERSLAFMRKNLSNRAYVGIKLHPSFNYTDAADERYRPVWEFAREHGLPIMSHTWDLSQTNFKQKYSHPTAFVKYLEEYPEVRFIMGHSGGRFNGIRHAVEIGRRFPQVYFDIAGDIHIAELMRYLTENVGDRRVLYGSDWVMMDQRTQLGAVLGADIPLASKERILCDNAAELFNFEEARA